MQNLLPRDGQLEYYPTFFSNDQAEAYFDKLKRTINWRSDSIRLFGKMVPQPRLTAWMADDGIELKYSGISMTPDPWSEFMLEIKTEVEKQTDHHFNGVLLNYYRDNRDYVSWHADNEIELGLNPTIASLSFGAVRRFQLKHRSKSIPTLTIELESGSLLVMKGIIQSHWIHRIAPSKKFSSSRINLTFRNILS